MWPECFASINCTSSPPVRDPSGSWEWNGHLEYNTEVLYTCGPYGKFLSENGTLEDAIVSTCMWNKTWMPSELLPCVANSCPIIPFPPKFSGLIFEPNEESSFSVVSEFSKYSPTVPSYLPVPAGFCTAEGTIAMGVGTILSDKTTSTADFIFKTDEDDEAFHVEIALGYKTVYRYAVQNGTYSKIDGKPNDDTTIDLEEPFTIRMSCDGDGWIAKINEEKSFLHFLHVVPFDQITRLEVSGDLDVSFLGIGDENMRPAPQLGFNITYKCPSGKYLELTYK